MKEEFIKEYPGQWALVKSAGEMYLGRLTKTPKEQESYDDYLSSKQCVSLNPCFTYISNIMSDESGRLSRNTAAIPLDLLLDDCDVTIVPDFVVLMNNLSDDDRKEYQRIVERCIEIVNNTKNARRQANSNIKLVSTMPNNVSNIMKNIKK